MSAIATPRRVEDTRPRSTRTFADRLLAAVPLVSIYLWLCIVYAFEAWRHVTPWLFTDELETTQISRAIAATGHAARRGEPYHLRSLYPLVLAPWWLIHNVATAYSAIKYFDVFAMTAVIFPTYFLARLVVRRGWALFAAAGAAAMPSLAYSSWIVQETWAYPTAALCFFLIAKALIEKRRSWIAAAIVAAAVAPFVRSELVMIPISVVFALAFATWTSEWGKARRSTWVDRGLHRLLRARRGPDLSHQRRRKSSLAAVVLGDHLLEASDLRARRLGCGRSRDRTRVSFPSSSGSLHSRPFEAKSRSGRCGCSAVSRLRESSALRSTPA